MKPQDITTAIKKRWWIIVALTLVAALTATLVAHFKQPVYKVEVKISAVAPVNVSTGNVDPTVQLAYQMQMASIADAAESIDIAYGVKKRIKIDVTAEDLVAKVSTTAVANSAEFKLTVSDESPTTPGPTRPPFPGPGEGPVQPLRPRLRSGASSALSSALPPETRR